MLFIVCCLFAFFSSLAVSGRSGKSFVSLLMNLMPWEASASSMLSMVALDTCTLPAAPVLSIFSALFEVTPNRWYLGSLIPTTPATQLPVWTPILILIEISRKSLSLMTSFKSPLAAQTHLAAWYLSYLSSGAPATAKRASPMISTLYRQYLSSTSSKLEYISFKNMTSSSGSSWLLNFVNPTMSTKRIEISSSLSAMNFP
mmetsp:Transcript_20925/g.43671  ORF Transcript_20925/g.43671 Transcript_20925/m.43671 type:complete len:201 (+) Transcript_20925:173-775(+)